MKKKKNPNRIPATRADVERAKREAHDAAVEMALTIVYTAMLDRCGMNVEDVRKVYEAANNVADSITKGYVTIADLKWTLRHEAGIEFGR